MKIKHRRDLWKLVVDSGLVGDAAEIGVAEGRFSEDILGWPAPILRLYLVDRWGCVPTQKGDASSPQSWHDKNYADAQARVARYSNRAIFLRGSSVEMATQVPDQSLCLLYIDADHSYEGVLADLRAWVPKVMAGGFVALHDYEARQYGVKGAVQTFCVEKGFQIHLIPEDKPEDAGAWFQC